MFGAFDEAKEVREMHKPGEVGVGKLDHAVVAEMKLCGNIHEAGGVTSPR